VGKEQQPKLSGQKSGEGSLLAYYLPPDPSIGADGVVTAVEENGKTAHLWLAGLPATVLESYGVNSLFTLLDPSSLVNSATNLPAIAPGETPESASLRSLQLQIRSREGLTAKAQLIQLTGAKKQEVSSELNAESLSQNSFLIGQLIQESVRVFPRNIGLTVALDSSLERIERVDATSAFANVPYVSSIVASGEQPADYLFGRMSSRLEVVSANQETTASGYGLFSLGRELIPNTVGEMGEAVKVAINRLMPKLKTRLAAKLWRMTANEGSSRLGVKASLEMVAPTEQVIMQRETWRSHSIFSGEFSNSNLGGSRPVSANNQTSSMPTKQKMSSFFEEGIPTLSIGSRIQYKIQNYSDRPIYFVLLGIDSSGSAIALYPLQSSPTTLIEETVIPPEETLTVPQPSTSFEWVVQGSSGLAETQLICSRYPLTQTLIALEAAMSSKRGRVRELLNPLEVARAVLQDLHQASTNTPEISGVASDTYTLDVNAWATLSFVYQVV
jgi:hypothetical protein